MFILKHTVVANQVLTQPQTVDTIWNIVWTSPLLLWSFSVWICRKQTSLSTKGSSLPLTESYKMGGNNIFGCGNQQYTAKSWKKCKKLETDSSNCDVEKDVCTQHLWIVEEQEDKLLVTLQLTRPLWQPTHNTAFQTSLLPCLQYIQLSVHPTRD